MDTIDVAQRRQQDDIDHALAARSPAGEGRPTCAECGEAISELRQQMGAVRCLECQRDCEREAQSWARKGS